MVDDPFIDVIQATVEALERVGATYAITGSIASGLFGEPIHSQDVDFMIRLSVDQARSLHKGLPERFYRSAERLEEVAREGGMANLIDTKTGLKIDLSVVLREVYHEEVLSRRVLTPFGPGAPSFYTVTPEDVILMKLLWRKGTGSQKQWENALGVVRVKTVSLDWKYLFEQARSLGIEDDLIKLRDEAGI